MNNTPKTDTSAPVLEFKPLPSFLNFFGMCCYDFARMNTTELNSFQLFLPHWKNFLIQIIPEAPIQNFCEEFQNILQCAESHKRAISEFYRLFKNPAPSVPLWESVWLGSDHALFGEQTVAVHSWYQSHGLQLPAKGEAADHIGLELIFFAFLLTNSNSTETNTRPTYSEEKAWEFWDTHPGKWVALCTLELALKTDDKFWKNFLHVCNKLFLYIERTN